MAHEDESWPISSVTTNGSVGSLAAVVDKKEPVAEVDPPAERSAAKVQQILNACGENDFDTVAALATSVGGLLEDDVRRTAWPVLLGCSNTASQAVHEPPWTSLPPYHDEEQVQKDVDRSFVHYPNNQSEKHIEIRRQQLSGLILEVLRRHPQLHYFQGFHDIVQVLLLVLGPDESPFAARRLSLVRIRDFMLPTISAAVTHLNLLPAILFAADRTLYRHLLPTNPFFALSATLTLYAHNIERYSDIARLFDFLLAHDASTPIYLFASIILLRREELLAIDGREEPEVLQFTLQKLPQPLDLEGVIVRTVQLKAEHPPEKLPFGTWGRVSQYSVLKTTRDANTLRSQTLKDGEELFEKHARELKRQQAIERIVKTVRKTAWRYRRSVALLGLTIAVAGAAWWLGGGQPHDQPFHAGILRFRFWNDFIRRLPGPARLEL